MNVNSPTSTEGMVKFGTIGAAVGATVQGLGTLSAQKKALSNPDEYIKTLTTDVAATKIKLSKTIESKTNYEAVCKQLSSILEDSKNWVKTGKLNYKEIAKKAGKGAVIAGITWASIYFIGKTIKNFVTRNDK